MTRQELEDALRMLEERAETAKGLAKSLRQLTLAKELSAQWELSFRYKNDPNQAIDRDLLQRVMQAGVDSVIEETEAALSVTLDTYRILIDEQCQTMEERGEEPVECRQ